MKIVIESIFQNFFKIYSNVLTFHFKFILTPVKKIAGKIIGKKTKLKKGAPTEMFRPVVTSIIKGHNY